MSEEVKMRKGEKPDEEIDALYGKVIRGKTTQHLYLFVYQKPKKIRHIYIVIYNYQYRIYSN